MRRSHHDARGSEDAAADAVAQVRDGRLEDFVREAVVLVARELMEAEISEQVSTELGEVAPESRVSRRNGYRRGRGRRWSAKPSRSSPRARQGTYFPIFLEPRRRSKQAIVVVVVQEAYVNSASTRKVDRLVEQLGIEGMTKDPAGPWPGSCRCTRSRRMAAEATCGRPEKAWCHGADSQ